MVHAHVSQMWMQTLAQMCQILSDPGNLGIKAYIAKDCFQVLCGVIPGLYRLLMLIFMNLFSHTILREAVFSVGKKKRGQGVTSLKTTSSIRRGGDSAPHCFPQPQAERARFDLEALMAFWASACQSVWCFHVVSTLPARGHCYRLNNLSRFMAAMGRIHVPNWRSKSSEMA